MKLKILLISILINAAFLYLYVTIVMPWINEASKGVAKFMLGQ